ncbi:MAG TPA: radical SAM protein, partial [Desulfobacteria bacterium]|nr:radical SAM protein [Desulfobacteria bacterium]
MQPGLYVHVPFCRSKCSYCGFYSIASKAPIDRWLEGLKKEIVLTQERQVGPFDSLYLGGGTPSFLSHTVLENLMATIFSHYPLTPDAEITLEANPCDISPEKADLFASLGFNRINLGVQSFNDHVLTFLGRRHSSKNAENAL